jgi:hypothetical protein
MRRKVEIRDIQGINYLLKWECFDVTHEESEFPHKQNKMEERISQVLMNGVGFN